MTKYDIKLRRKALSKGQIERHKDFKNLYHMTPERKRSGTWIRLAVIVFAIAAFVAMIALGISRWKEMKNVKEEVPTHDVFDEFKDQ